MMVKLRSQRVGEQIKRSQRDYPAGTKDQVNQFNERDGC